MLACLVLLWIAMAAAAVAPAPAVAGIVLVTAGIAHSAMTPPALHFDGQDVVGVIGALFSDR